MPLYNPSIGSKILNVVSKTTTYTITTADDVVNCSSSGGAFTVTLYAASGNSGRVVTVTKTDSSANAVRVEGNAAETIDGALYTDLYSPFESVTLYCDGSAWFIRERSNPNSFAYLRAGKTSGSHTSSGSYQTVSSWNTETDPSSSFDTSTGVFTVKENGRYIVACSLSFNASAAGNARAVQIQNNGTVYAYGSLAPTGGIISGVAASASIDCVNGDTIRLQAFQDTGGNLDYYTTAGYTTLFITKVGSSV